MESQELNKVYNASTYANKFLATEKQKDFIINNPILGTHLNSSSICA